MKGTDDGSCCNGLHTDSNKTSDPAWPSGLAIDSLSLTSPCRDCTTPHLCPGGYELTDSESLSPPFVEALSNCTDLNFDPEKSS